MEGWVSNLDDGRVEAVFEGEKNQPLRVLLDIVYHGPSAAKVDKVEVEYEKFAGEFSDFKIR